jgi:hypothetical protein
MDLLSALITFTLILSQGFSQVLNAPACVLNCVVQTCPTSTDTVCICASANTNTIAACVLQSCNAADQAVGVQLASQLCSGTLTRELLMCRWHLCSTIVCRSFCSLWPAIICVVCGQFFHNYFNQSNHLSSIFNYIHLISNISWASEFNAFSRSAIS